MDLNTIRKITIQADTPGVDAAAKSLDNLSAAQGRLATASTTTATVTDVSSRKQLSAADAYQRQTLAIDPLARAQSLLAKQVNIANAAFSQGALGDVNSAQAKAVLSQRVADLTSKYMSHVGAADQVKTGWLSMINVEGLLERSMIRLGELFALREILIFTKDVFENTAALKDQAERVGEGVEAFQAQTAVLRQAGLTTQDAGQSIAKLNKNMGEAMATTGIARSAFHDLGITFTDLAGGPEAALPKVAQQLLKIQDASERARLEVALFGKSGQQLESSLRALADPTATLIEQQKALRQVIGTDVVDAAHEADVKINQAWNSIKVGTAPIVVGLTSALVDLIEKMKELGEAAPKTNPFFWLDPLNVNALRDEQAKAKASPPLADMPGGMRVPFSLAGIGSGSPSTAPPQTQFGQQEWAQYLKDQEEAARLTGLSAQERAAETEAIKESVKYQELSGVSAKDLNHTYEGAKTTLDAHTLAHARNLGLMSEQNKAAEKLKETYDQYLAGLGQEAHDAGLTNSQRAIEVDTIKAAQIVQKENNVLSRDQVKTYQEALKVLGPIKAAEVERAEQAKATAAFTLQSTQQQVLAQTAFDAGRDDRALAVQMKQKELELGRQLTDVEKDRLKTDQQLNDATRMKDYLEDLQTEVKLAGMSADDRERESAAIQAGHTRATAAQQDQIRGLIVDRQETEKWRQVVDDISNGFQGFFEDVLNNGKLSFQSLWDSIKQSFVKMLAYMATQALINPIIVPMVEGFAGSIGMSPGLSGSAPGLLSSLGGGSDFLGIGSGINSLGSMLGFATAGTAGSLTALPALLDGAGGLSGGLGSIGLGSVSSGLPGLSGSIFGATSLGGLIGGAGLGSIASSLIFGNKNSAGIGGMGGALAGAAIGSIIPGIGTIIGGLIGGLAGGGLGSLTGTSNQGAISNFTNGGLGNTLFKVGGGNNGQLATQASGTINTALKALQDAGVTVSLGNVTGLSIGSDKSYVYDFAGGKQKLAGGQDGVQATVNAILDRILPSATGSDDSTNAILQKYRDNGGINSSNITQLASDLQAAKTAADNLKTQVDAFGPGITAALKAIADPVGAQYDALINNQKTRLAQAQQLGVDVKQLDAVSSAEVGQFLKGLSSDQLKGLIAANDITGNIAQYAQDMADAADATAAAADAAKLLASNVTSAQNDLVNAYNDQKQQLQQTVSQYQGLASGLRSYLGQIGAASSNPVAQYGASRNQFLATSALAQTGDATALQNLQQVADAFLSASKTASQTLSQYSRDRSLVVSDVGTSANVADSKVSDAVQQLAALDQSVEALITLNKTTLSVKDAIDEMQAALTEQSAATAANTAKIANILTRVTLDGTSLLTKAA